MIYKEFLCSKILKFEILYSFKIRTGYQKWIYRYLSECPGHIKNGNHSKRLRKLTNNIFYALRDKLHSESDWSNADWENDFYHHEGSNDPLHCCTTGYYWTSPTGENVWMRNAGYFGGYPYYMAVDSSENPTKYLWWNFVEDPRENPTPTPGYWNLGDYLGDISLAIQGAKSYTACPHDKKNKWGHFVQLKCGEAPQQPQLD